MHIPDGFVSGGINAAMMAASAAACAVALRKTGAILEDRQIPLLGTTAAFIFAAQMVNFPVAGGTSGHFLGAAFAAIMLGPLGAVLVMAVVIFIQCLLFADGGLASLGTNIFNMGIAGPFAGYLLFRFIKSLLPDTRRSFLLSAAGGAWISVVAVSALCALELALSGTSPLEIVLPAMVAVHAVTGLGEGIITAAILSAVMAARPDLIGARIPEGAA